MVKEKELQVLGTLLEYDAFSPREGQTVRAIYKAVLVDGQAEQHLTIKSASGETLSQTLLHAHQHITPEQIKQAKEVLT